MENNNVCARMYDAVVAICGNSDDSVFLQSMIAEINRLFPIFSKEVTCSPILGTIEEDYLRKIGEQIDNFYLVYLPQMDRNASLMESKAYKDFLSLLNMIETTVENYFTPPTFEPQQIEPTYKLLMEHKNVIAEVMGVSSDSFADRVMGWLQGKRKNTDEAVGELKSKLVVRIPENAINSLLQALPTIGAKELRRNWYNKYLASYLGQREFFELCESVVCRTGEKGWNYENFKKG